LQALWGRNARVEDRIARALKIDYAISAKLPLAGRKRLSGLAVPDSAGQTRMCAKRLGQGTPVIQPLKARFFAYRRFSAPILHSLIGFAHAQLRKQRAVQNQAPARDQRGFA
jgi:hypothetical protein